MLLLQYVQASGAIVTVLQAGGAVVTVLQASGAHCCYSIYRIAVLLLQSFRQAVLLL